MPLQPHTTSLPAGAHRILQSLAALAHAHSMKLYLVGGGVRDLLLGVNVREFDLAVDTDLKTWLDLVHAHWSDLAGDSFGVKRPVFFKKYLTGKILCEQPFLPGMSGIDFSQLRSEHYQFSGAYPVVVPGDMRSDQLRRDFTMNAMALELLENGELSLIDLFSGVVDLEGRVLRVLHEQSFEDDPVRLVRGVRFAVRFSCAFESRTKELFDVAARENFLARVPRKRLFEELKKALLEDRWCDVLCAMEREELLGQIAPGVYRVTDEITQSSERGDEERGALWDRRFVMLYRETGFSALAEALRSYEVSRSEIDRLLSLFESIASGAAGSFAK